MTPSSYRAMIRWFFLSNLAASNANLRKFAYYRGFPVTGKSSVMLVGDTSPNPKDRHLRWRLRGLRSASVGAKRTSTGRSVPYVTLDTQSREPITAGSFPLASVSHALYLIVRNLSPFQRICLLFFVSPQNKQKKPYKCRLNFAKLRTYTILFQLQ